MIVLFYDSVYGDGSRAGKRARERVRVTFAGAVGTRGRAGGS